MNDEDDKGNLNDAAAGYGLRRTIKLSSLKEQEEDNYRYWISLTPEQRIASVTTLIESMFADELKIARDNRLFFDSL